MAVIRTVGHGTLDAAELVALLRRSGVDCIADVRRYPGSRRHPHFAREALEQRLLAVGIGYRWIGALGGRREPVQASPHVGLRNPQFRAYADHMASEEFAGGLAELRDMAAARSVAIMCSESVWWRCHRRLVADHLVLVDHIAVEHLFHDGRVAAHQPTAGARVDSAAVTYDVVDQPSLFATGADESGTHGRAGDLPSD